MTDGISPTGDHDLLDYVLGKLLRKGYCTAEQAEEVRIEAERDHGGERFILRKRRSRMKELEQRQKLYLDILTDTPTDELARRHGVSRATIYRVAKRGPA